MFWLKLFLFYPIVAMLLYVTSGKTIASMILGVVMFGLIKLSVFLLRELTNN